MAIEKKWEEISPRPFTSNGTAEGVIALASTLGFKVKQVVILKASSGISNKFEIKRIPSLTSLIVGPVGGTISARSDISAFTTALSSTVQAEEQGRNAIPDKEYERAKYAEEPIVAERVIEVDQMGNYFGQENPRPSLVEFLRNGQAQPVVEDTVNPANNRPLPVKITGINGDIIIDAENLNLETQSEGVYDSAENPNPDNVGVILHERNSTPGDAQQTQRVTAKKGTTDTDTVSQDVALHDHDGNKFSETNQFPTNSTIRDADDPTKKATVTDDGEVKTFDPQVLQKLQDILTSLGLIEGFVDGLESLVGASNALLTTIRDNADQVEGLLTAIGTNTDGIESLISSSNSLLTTIRDNADQVESLITISNSLLTAIDSNTDGIEGLITSSNALLTTIRDNADQVESLLTTTNSLLTAIGSNTDGIEALITTSNSLLTTIRDNADQVESLITASNTLLTTIRDNADQVESLITTSNTLLTAIGNNTDQLEGFVDGVEGLLTTIRDNADQVETSLSSILAELDAAHYSMNEAFVKAIGIAGQLDDVGTTAATEGNMAPVRITAQRALHSNLRDNSGVEIGTTSNPFGIRPGVDTVLASTSTPLAVSGVYNSAILDLTTVQGTEITIGVFADQASAASGLQLKWSHDGTNFDHIESYTNLTAMSAGGGKTFTQRKVARYLQVTFTNGGVIQGAFRLTVYLNAFSSKPSSHRIGSTLDDNNDAQLVKANITGRHSDGTHDNLQSTNQNALHVNLRNDAGTEIATAANPARISGTGSAGIPSTEVVTVQGIQSGVPQKTVPLAPYASDSYPNPIQAYPDYNAQQLQNNYNLNADVFGNLQIRGPVITDEVSSRNDFIGSALAETLTGTVKFANNSTQVDGNGTSFTTQVKTGSYIKRTAGTDTEWVQVDYVQDDNTLFLTGVYSGNFNNVPFHQTEYNPTTVGGASYNVASSLLNLVSSTANGNQVYIEKQGDYLPFNQQLSLSITQRIANQTAWIGFRDNSITPTKQASIVFDGTSNTTVKFVTSSSSAAADTETTTVVLPGGATTAVANTYQIDLVGQQAILLINGLIATTATGAPAIHTKHIPGPYDILKLSAGILNSAVVTTTTLTIDYIYFSNQDRLNVGNDFSSDGLAVALSDSANNQITSSSQAGTSKKQPLDTHPIPTASGYYCTTFSFRQSAATAANATVFAMRNASASTRTVYIERMMLTMDFNATTAVARTNQYYIFQRFSAATPTAGTALSAGQMDSSDAASQVTDIRFLDTGLTTTGVTFDTKNLGLIGNNTFGSMSTTYIREGVAIKLAPGEGFCIRLGVAAVIGQELQGEIHWSER